MASRLPLPEAAAVPASAHATVLRLASRVPAMVFLLTMIAFIVYGSLFPFNFRSEPLSIESFFAESNLFGNRSDAIDNLLLFVPLGVGLHACFRSATGRVLAAILAVLVLAIGIQMVQLYLPSRVASVSDAFWNTIGMIVGMMFGSRVRRVLQSKMAQQFEGRDHFLLCLLLLWFFYESYPFVPTLDIGLLRSHVKTFVFAPPFELMRLAQHGLAASLAGIAMMRLGWLRRPALGLLLLGGGAMLLEVVVAYGQLRRETMAGMAIGLAAGYLMVRHARRHSHDIAFALALATFLITVVGPYRGQALDGGFTLTPFSHLLWAGLLNEVAPAAFEALAIGVMLWAGMAGPRRFAERPVQWCGLVLALLVFLEIVRMQVFGFHADTTALTMALVLAPAAVSLRTRGTFGAADASHQHSAASTGGSHNIGSMADTNSAGNVGSFKLPGSAGKALHPAMVRGAVLVGAFALCMWLLVHLPGIPYNLAKLFGQHALIGALMFALALLWLGAGPWLAVRAALALDARRRHGTLWMPLLLLGVALVSFVLVDLATPSIMLDKIIGAPDLYRRVVEEHYWGEAWGLRMAAWPGELVRPLERVLRYLALYSLLTIPLAVCLHATVARDRRARVLFNLLWLLPFWVLAKLVVLDWAITDNLTELVAEGGAAYLAVLLILLTANAAGLAGHAGTARRWPLLGLATAVGLGASWWLLHQGVESIVINHGRVFSGVQFLLGQNRTAILSDSALALRWGVVYLGAVALLATGIGFARRYLTAPLSASGTAAG